MNNLLSLVLELQPRLDDVDLIKPWYGRASQSICLRAIRDGFSRSFAHAMHVPNMQRAYTASSLFSDQPLNRRILPGAHYFLRYTALNTCAAQALICGTLPGQPLCVGRSIDLAGLSMEIMGVYVNKLQHPMASSTSYENLWDDTVKDITSLDHHISLSLNSPVFFKSTQTKALDPYPTAGRVFASLYNRWKLYTPITVPRGYDAFCESHMKIAFQDLHLVHVEDKQDRTGSVGIITITTDQPGSRFWLFTHILARYAFFAGLGKETARGFGQCNLFSSTAHSNIHSEANRMLAY